MSPSTRHAAAVTTVPTACSAEPLLGPPERSGAGAASGRSAARAQHGPLSSTARSTASRSTASDTPRRGLHRTRARPGATTS